MAKSLFYALIVSVGALFTIAFAVLVVPPLVASGDVFGAIMGGFVNPYASGYALDTIMTGVILIVWILYERRTQGVRHGWVCIVVCLAPGVATALAMYLVLRTRGRPVPLRN